MYTVKRRCGRRYIKINPATANRLHPNDTRRLIRALELYEQKQQPMSKLQSKHAAIDDSPFNYLMIGLTMPRELLYQRINQRVQMMIEEGLVDEVQSLVQRGINQQSTSMQSLGYKEMLPYLEGKASLDDTVALIQQKTRQFAKRQLTWFRRMKSIEWFDFSPEQQQKNLSQIIQIVAGKFENIEN